MDVGTRRFCWFQYFDERLLEMVGREDRELAS